MIRQAIILAAGKGQRIRVHEKDLPKPLHPVAGVPLLKRTILTLHSAGVTKFWVVVGFMADTVTEALFRDRDLRRLGIHIETILNRDYELANGVSLLAARSRVDGPFVLSMCDHVYDPHLADLAVAADMEQADLVLCVDRRIDEVYDIDDATKVRTDGVRIVDIGKTLRQYDAIDCGVFAVGPAMFDRLAELAHVNGDCSLSEGVMELAKAGRAHTVDIGRAFWQDVDTDGARLRAEGVFLADEQLARVAS